MVAKKEEKHLLLTIKSIVCYVLTQYTVNFLECFSDSQKRRSVATSGPLSATRSSQDPDEVIIEKESEPLEEFIDGNFPVSIYLWKVFTFKKQIQTKGEVVFNTFVLGIIEINFRG